MIGTACRLNYCFRNRLTLVCPAGLWIWWFAMSLALLPKVSIVLLISIGNPGCWDWLDCVVWWRIVASWAPIEKRHLCRIRLMRVPLCLFLVNIIVSVSLVGTQVEFCKPACILPLKAVPTGLLLSTRQLLLLRIISWSHNCCGGRARARDVLARFLAFTAFQWCGYVWIIDLIARWFLSCSRSCSKGQSAHALFRTAFHLANYLDCLIFEVGMQEVRIVWIIIIIWQNY